MIFSCKSHRNFFQKLPLQCRHFLENPLAKNPKSLTQLVINGATVPKGHVHRVTYPEKPRKIPGPSQNPADPRRSLGLQGLERPPQRPLRTPLRGKFPRRASGRAPQMVTLPNFRIFHAQYDWTTGVPDNGNEWRKFRAVPRSHPLRFLVLYFV